MTNSISKETASEEPYVGTQPKCWCKHQEKSCMLNAFKGGAKNFAIGVALKVIISLLRNLVKMKMPTVYLGKSIREFLALDPIRFGLFMGSFAFSYKCLICIIRHMIEEDNKLIAFIAGALSGIAILWVDKADRFPIALYLLIRAAKIAYHAACTRPWFPQTLKDIPQGGTLLMMVAASQILYSYINNPQSLPPNYQNFLIGAGSKPKHILNAVHVATEAGRQGFRSNPALIQYFTQAGVVSSKKFAHLLAPGFTQDAMCGVMHPGRSCSRHWFDFVVQHLKSYSLRFYLSLNIASLILFRAKRLVTEPLQSLYQTLKSTVRSALFLSIYCGNAWFAVCLLRKLNMLSPAALYVTVGILAGMATLIEQKNRRLELGLYCMSPALTSLYTLLLQWKWIGVHPQIEMAMFSAAMGSIMMTHQNRASRLTPTFRTIFSALMGID